MLKLKVSGFTALLSRSPIQHLNEPILPASILVRNIWIAHHSASIGTAASSSGVSPFDFHRRVARPIYSLFRGIKTRVIQPGKYFWPEGYDLD